MSDIRSPQVLPTRKPTQHLERFSEAEIPTQRGPLRTIVFRDRRNGREHVALVAGNVSGVEGVPVRIHSECLTSEVFGSLKCDCREQLERAQAEIARRGVGVLLYLRQEGRGIGLANKIRAYALQAKGADTIEANELLHLPVDARTYDVAAAMLKELGVESVELLTNNPLKLNALLELGVHVERRVP